MSLIFQKFQCKSVLELLTRLASWNSTRRSNIRVAQGFLLTAEIETLTMFSYEQRKGLNTGK